MKPLISVVIPAYNEKDHILALLDSLSKQNLSHKLFDIIIVNNNSTDNTPAIIKI